MKKFILLFTFIAIYQFMQADQLAWISKEQAIKATELLSKEKQLILWCACCSDDQKMGVNVTSVTYDNAKMGENVFPEYYQLTIKGTDTDGNSIEMKVDLAYVHIKGEDGKTRCFGSLIGECEPCTEPFAWATVFSTKTVKKKGKKPTTK